MKKPRILGLDIETAPATVLTWTLFNANIGVNQILRPSRMLCWGAKWFGRPGFHFEDERPLSVSSKSTDVDETDHMARLRMMSRLHALMSEADALVTYNGDRFDLPKINGEFVSVGLRPIPPTPSIDLIKTVRRLGLQSSRLEFVAPYLQIGAKVQSGGFKLWRDCLDGNPEAWRKMRRYNEQDVRLLEKLHDRLGPFITKYPALFPSTLTKPACGKCGASRMQSRGSRTTLRVRIQRLQCTECGKWADGKREVVK